VTMGQATTRRAQVGRRSPTQHVVAALARLAEAGETLPRPGQQLR